MGEPVPAGEMLRLAAELAGGPAWLVGGAVRDRLLERPTTDHDVAIAGDPEILARALARRAGGHPFALSDAFGAWRVVARDRSWQLDVLAVQGGGLETDLLRRDLTVNAIAEPLDGQGGLVDPAGGVADLRRRTLRMVAADAFLADPLRVLRLARLAAGLGFGVEPATLARARASAGGLITVSPERVFAELRGLLLSADPLAGLELMDALGATAVVLPELAALDGVTQSEYHDRDVAGHTRATLARVMALVEAPARLGLAGADAERLRAWLARPLADELTRGQALRIGALLHDIAKPRTRGVTEGGRVTFMGHDARGAQIAREILTRLRASQRLADHVAALTRHHLDLGFLVRHAPLQPRAVHDYLRGCAPVGVDVTVLSVADRLATRGRDAEPAIARHLALAADVLPAALRFEAEPPRSPVRGDELAAALGIPPGPVLGGLLAELGAAAWSGELADRAAALALARTLLAVEG